MKNWYPAALLLALLTALVGCSDDAPSAKTLGQQKQIAIENAGPIQYATVYAVKLNRVPAP